MTLAVPLELIYSKEVDIADEGIDEMEEESQDSLQIDEMDSIKSLIQHFSSRHLLSSWKVMSQHDEYFSRFLRTHYTLIRGDGPLPAHVRHFIAIMAASAHSCFPLVELHKTELIAAGGPISWLEHGLSAASVKVQRLSEINRILAHQPWTLTPAHIEAITRSGTPGNWSLSELVYAIVLMAHFHAFSSFIESCSSMEDDIKNKFGKPTVSSQVFKDENPTKPFDCTSQNCSPTRSSERVKSSSKASKQPQGLDQFSKSPPYDCSRPKTAKGSPETDLVDMLVQKMQLLREKPEPDSDELAATFDKVKMTSADIGLGAEARRTTPDLRKFVTNPDFHYVDFAQRDFKQQFPTFRIQEYNWDEQGFSLISRFYDDIAQLLDDKFKTAYNMTYGTMGRYSAIDTSMYRRATWNYIQCLYGIRWDDYDYAEVNELLHRSLKGYVKTAACYPDRCSRQDYKHIMTDFLPSEKIHVCLLVAEAKFQSELLYALKAVAVYFRS